jgi:hypothetical protein
LRIGRSEVGDGFVPELSAQGADRTIAVEEVGYNEGQVPASLKDPVELFRSGYVLGEGAGGKEYYGEAEYETTGLRDEKFYYCGCRAGIS